MHSLNHLSSLIPTPPLLMPSSSAFPALLPCTLGKTLHPGHHSNDSNAVALAALSANWGNYNLAAAGVPFLPFLLFPGSSSSSLSFLPSPSPSAFPSFHLNHPFTLPPTLLWLLCPLLLTRPSNLHQIFPVPPILKLLPYPSSHHPFSSLFGFQIILPSHFTFNFVVRAQLTGSKLL